MARSAGDSPRSETAQSFRRAVESATWNTGQPGASSGEGPPSAPLAENAVALTMAAGARRASSVLSQSAAPASLRLAAKAPMAAKPRASSAAISPSTGSVSAEVR
jgi:hypothetical protein